MRANLLPKGKSPRGPIVRKLLIGIGIGVGVLAFLALCTPLGGVVAGAADSAVGGDVKHRQTYAGVITRATNGGDLTVGSRCDVELRQEDRLLGDGVKMTLACGGRGLYGQQEDLGWIAESTRRDGEVVHALDQWDDEGDPGIEFKRDEGTVTYWDKTGLRLTIALEGLPQGRLPAEHDSALVPAELAVRPGLDAAGAIASPAQGVSETCAPGVVCWAPRIDVSF
jgi:hypothetical protein